MKIVYFKRGLSFNRGGGGVREVKIQEGCRGLRKKQPAARSHIPLKVTFPDFPIKLRDSIELKRASLSVGLFRL